MADQTKTRNETAAAILVQIAFDHDKGLRGLLQAGEISKSPEAVAQFMKSYFDAMVKELDR